MSDVRVNGKRFPILSAVDSLVTLVSRLDVMAQKEAKSLTAISINGMEVDLDNPEYLKLKLDSQDTVEALMESAHDLALQSLQVAQEMAELLVFDLKVATLNLWENTRSQAKTLETLLKDCHLFLTLAARPVELMGRTAEASEKEIETCLRQLDNIANNIEDAILLAAHSKQRDSCHILVGRVIPAIEKWLGLTQEFSEKLDLGNVEFNVSLPGSADLEVVP